MSQAISTVPSIALRGAVQAPRLIDTAVAFARTIAAEWQVHRAVQAIGQLDDRTLADIGIGRSEAESAVRHGRSRASRVAIPVSADTQPLMPLSFTEWR